MPLGSDTKKTVIFEAELIASVAAIILWRGRIVNKTLVAFVDNNSVRGVCISGKVRNAIGHQLITLLLAAKDLAGLNTWIARVLALRTLLIFYPEKTQKKFFKWPKKGLKQAR